MGNVQAIGDRLPDTDYLSRNDDRGWSRWWNQANELKQARDHARAMELILERASKALDAGNKEARFQVNRALREGVYGQVDYLPAFEKVDHGKPS